MSSIRKSWLGHWSRTLLWAKALQTPCTMQQLHCPTNQVDNCIAGEDVWRLRQGLGIIFQSFLFTSHAAHLSHAYFFFFLSFLKWKGWKFFTLSFHHSQKLILGWTGCQTYPFSWWMTERLSVPRRVIVTACLVFFTANRLSLSALSLTLTVSRSVSGLGAQLGQPPPKPAGEGLLRVWTWLALKVCLGEKKPTSYCQSGSGVSAGPASKQTWNYSISVCHMSSSAVHWRRGEILWWST